MYISVNEALVYSKQHKPAVATDQDSDSEWNTLSRELAVDEHCVVDVSLINVTCLR